MVYKYRFLGSYVSCRNSKTTTLSTQWALLGNRGESRTIATADWTINAWTLQKCYKRNLKKNKETFVYHWSYNAELEWCGATRGCGELWNDIFHSIIPCSKMVTLAWGQVLVDFLEAQLSWLIAEHRFLWLLFWMRQGIALSATVRGIMKFWNPAGVHFGCMYAFFTFHFVYCHMSTILCQMHACTHTKA